MKKGEVYVKDLGEGYTRYEIVTADSGEGVSWLVTPDGKTFGITLGLLFRDPQALRYGDPVPVEAAEGAAA